MQSPLLSVIPSGYFRWSVHLRWQIVVCISLLQQWPVSETCDAAHSELCPIHDLGSQDCPITAPRLMCRPSQNGAFGDQEIMGNM